MDALQPDDPVNVGAYQLVGRIGAGGMGRVYLGVSPGGRKVAVKLIHPDHASAPEYRDRFAREVEAARRVGGFHTAQVVDADPLADPPWMATAFIQGRSLEAEVSAGGPLGPDEVRSLGAGLAEGLAAIHACGLVHRDIKPSNVIVGEDGPRIIDFGIARLVGASTMTASGAVFGSVPYMSPEQVKGEAVGPASDVFSLASTLVFAATGHSPFEAETTVTVVYRIVSEQPDLRRLPGNADFRQLIAGSLAKNPADRPSLAEILAALAAVGEPGLATQRSADADASADTAGASYTPTAAPGVADAASRRASPGGVPAAIGDVTADIARAAPVRDREPAAAGPPARRRRWPIWLSAAAVVATAGFTGIYLALSPDGPPKGTAGPSASHTATSPRPTPTPTHAPAPAPTAMDFRQLGSADDTTFNELLAINGEGVIAGYFGSGTKGHPNKGYVVKPPYGQRDFTSENYPGSAQTQVTGLNDNGVTVGFWSATNNASGINANVGFYLLAGHGYHSVTFPTGDNADPPVNQLLGVNDHDVAVAFYLDDQGNGRGYTYNITTKTFTPVTVPGAPSGAAAPSLLASAINDDGDVAGSYENKAGVTVAFLDRGGRFTTFAFPGASGTTALGVNDHDEIVGYYTVGVGGNQTTHGFTWTPGGGFRTIDDPNGVGTTTLNGINDENSLVGFYVDSAGRTDGMLASSNP
jgi:Protein kinase domain